VLVGGDTQAASHWLTNDRLQIVDPAVTRGDCVRVGIITTAGSGNTKGEDKQQGASAALDVDARTPASAQF
jgi:hypothetical protein